MDQGQSSGSKKGIQVILNLEKKAEERGGSVVGKLLTSKNLNSPTVISMIKKGWQLGEKVEIHELDRNQLIFLFRFSNHADYARIMKGRPWSILGFLLNLQAWDENMVLKDTKFDSEPFWVQFHGLPLAAFDDNNAKILGDSVGKSVMYESPMVDGKMGRGFIRVRTLISLDKPLLNGVWIPREGKDPAWVSIKYERLQIFCFKCGRLGHEGRSCSEPGDWEGVGKEDHEYGNWMATPWVRTCEGALKVCNWDWMEAFFFKKNLPTLLADRSSSPEKMKDSLGVSSAREQEWQTVGFPRLVFGCQKGEYVVHMQNSKVIPSDQRDAQEGKVVEGLCAPTDQRDAQENDLVIVGEISVMGHEGPIGPVGVQTFPKEIGELNQGSPTTLKQTQPSKMEFPVVIELINESSQSNMVAFNGLSPISSMALSLTRIQIKRVKEESPFTEASKRQRRLCFEEASPTTQPNSVKSLTPRGRRRNFRALKQQIRRAKGGEIEGRSVIDPGNGEIDFPPSWLQPNADESYEKCDLGDNADYHAGGRVNPATGAQ